jgi:two-component system, OmpR family, sensor histidine kinase VicK
LSSSALPLTPKGKDYAMSAGETDEKKEEQPDGLKYTINKTLEILSKVKYRFDNCGDARYPSAIVTTKPFTKALLDIKNKGIKIRVITEITKDNLSYCKELMQVVNEVRHLDGVKGNFTVTDTEYVSYAISSEEARPSLTKAVLTISKELVQQQQHFFDMLWNKAIPAEQKVMEMESGIMLPERTEIINGAYNILRLTLESVPHIRESLDNCIDSNSPVSFFLFEPMWNHLKELASTKNGVRFRFITEITKDNLPYCKEMAKIFELRHLNGIKGNLEIIDGREYRASPSIKPGVPPDVLIRSTAKVFVEQQQFFFETLWSKAIPAEHRIKEIEEGREPEKLEIIPDTRKSISLAFDIMNKTQKELLVLFATPRTLILALQAGAADIYRKISKNGVDIKLLIPRGAPDEIEQNNEQIAKVREEIASSPSINLRFSDVALNTRITIMISDRNEFMSWELRDDTLDDLYMAGGIATYSNIKALASSYAVIFDSLWKITEFAENLRIANIKLEGNEKAMKEFINIAAHELRAPIQPIVGLSEMLSDARNDPQQQKKLFDVIIRNAHKLENLAEDVLDVTRIESGRLQLSMQKIDLYELVESVVSDFQRFLPADGNVTMSYQQKLSDDFDENNKGMSRVVVLGDPERIVQVLSNLLRNALKFTNNGKINVRVGRKDSPSYGEAIVSISDSGKGIDPEVKSKLFEKFVSKSEKGTGLGLFISKSIIEAHRGKIWGENNKDAKGATFTFTLPLAT